MNLHAVKSSLIRLRRLLPVALGLMGAAQAAASYCTATYTMTSAASNQIGIYNYTNNTIVPLFPAASANSNAITQSPTNGRIYYINRDTNTVRYIDPNTLVDTSIGTLNPLPTVAGTNVLVVGGTTDASGNYYVYLNNKTFGRVDASGNIVGGSYTPFTAPTGYTLGTTTNGDLAIDSAGQAYIVATATPTAGVAGPYLFKLDLTTGLLSSPVAIKSTAATAWTGTVNGLSIDPRIGNFLISSATGPTTGLPGIYPLNPTTGVTGATPSATISDSLTDLGTCATLPNSPTVTKSFSPNSIAPGATSTLTITLGNTNLAPVYLQSTFTDNLPTTPSNMVIAATPNLGGTCTTITGNTVSASINTGTITLNAGGKIPAGGCTITVSVTASSVGTYTNTIAASALDTTGGTNAAAASASLLVTASISGTVFDDINGDGVQAATGEAGTNAGTSSLTVYAVNGTTVAGKATVSATDGTYTIGGLLTNTTYTLRLSTNGSVAVGGTAPTTGSVPSNWVNTGENSNGTKDATADGNLAVTIAAANVTAQNFGIEQLPDTTSATASSQQNASGTSRFVVPTLTGTDPEDGALGAGSTFCITSLPTNATLFYQSVVVSAGQCITAYVVNSLQVDPTSNGALTVSFQVAARDAAGQQDPSPATITMPFIAEPSGACLVHGGTLGTNLFSLNGTFGSVAAGSSTNPPTRRTLAATGSLGSTGYTYNTRTQVASPGNYSPEDGEYEVTNFDSDRQDGAWHVLGDHTTGNATGQMMVVNANLSANVFYQEKFAVTPNTNYEVGGWIVNLIANNAGIVPNVSIEVDYTGVDDDDNPATADGSEGQSIFTSGNIANTNAPIWKNFSLLVNTGAASEVTVRFRNNTGGGGGNDLALDDLSWTTCTGITTGNISGTVYGDMDNSSSFSTPDSRFGAGIPVTLTNSSSGITSTAFTDANGNYSFLNVPTDPYTATIRKTDPDLGNATLISPASGTYSVTLTGGASITSRDFGFNPNLTATKTVSASSTTLGGTLTYTIAVKNTSTTVAAANVKFLDVLPSGLTYIPNTATLNGTNLNASSYPYGTASLINSAGQVAGTLAAGATATVTFQVQVGNSGVASPISNQGVVSQQSVNVPTDDPTVTGVSDPTRTTLTVVAPSVTLSKYVRNIGSSLSSNTGTFSSAGAVGKPGEYLEYCIAYTNTGAGNATSLVLKDTIVASGPAQLNGYGAGLGILYANGASLASGATAAPAGTALTSASGDDAGDLTATNLTVNVGTVAASTGKGVVCFKAQVP